MGTLLSTSLSKTTILPHGQEHIYITQHWLPGLPGEAWSWENQSGDDGVGNGWGISFLPYHPQLLDLENADV